MPRASGLSEYTSWLSIQLKKDQQHRLEYQFRPFRRLFMSLLWGKFIGSKAPFKQFYAKNMESREGKQGRPGGLGLVGKMGCLGGSQPRPRHGNRPNPGRIGVDSPDWGIPSVPGTEWDLGTPANLTVSLWKSSNRRSVLRRDPLCALSPISFSFVLPLRVAVAG